MQLLAMHAVKLKRLKIKIKLKQLKIKLRKVPLGPPQVAKQGWSKSP